MSATIRLATVADAAAIARIKVETWRAAYRDLLPEEHLAGMDVAHHTERWRSILAGESETLVACNDAVVGFASVGRSRDADANADTGELLAMYVQPSDWSSGAGRALMLAAEDRLRAAGFRTATLWVLRDNVRARRFYECASWSHDGTTKSETIGARDVVEVRYRRAL
jgi:GNAT superfamily N-acetyltransferase